LIFKFFFRNRRAVPERREGTGCSTLTTTACY
jgi:hypothetical protein